MTNIVELQLINIEESDANRIVLNLSRVGGIEPIGSVHVQLPEGLIELMIVENQGNDQINIVNIDGRIGTPFLVELDHNNASKVRIATPDGSIKSWAKKI